VPGRRFVTGPWSVQTSLIDRRHSLRATPRGTPRPSRGCHVVAPVAKTDRKMFKRRTGSHVTERCATCLVRLVKSQSSAGVVLVIVAAGLLVAGRT
jgi:hypothetical protein